MSGCAQVPHTYEMSRLSKTEAAMVILAILYVLSPVDVIPEMLAGPLGIGDDAAILGLVAAMLMRASQRPKVVPATVRESDLNSHH